MQHGQSSDIGVKRRTDEKRRYILNIIDIIIVNIN